MKTMNMETVIRLREQLKHALFEMEERHDRQEQFCEELTLKDRLIRHLCSQAETLEGIDLWEFEAQIIAAQKQQAEQEKVFLERDVQMHRLLIRQLEKEFPQDGSELRVTG